MKTIGKNSDLFKLFDFEKHRNQHFQAVKTLRGFNEIGFTSNELGGRFSEYLSFERYLLLFQIPIPKK